MDRIITYNLRAIEGNSDEYYKTISRFTDQWLALALPRTHHLAKGSIDHRSRSDLPFQMEISFAFDLLVLGVFLRQHGDEAERIARPLKNSLEWLVQLQANWPRMEWFIKAMRGLVFHLASSIPGRATKGYDRLETLSHWLTAMGENTIADRIGKWNDYFHSAGIEKEALSICVALAAEFAIMSEKELGIYTQNVENFLENTKRKWRCRYDAGLIRKTRLEYHLGMVGTEMLNRVYRDRFDGEEIKIIILPPCMRAQLEGQCKSEETPLGGRCAACTPTCRVHQITKLGEKNGFQVFIMPDELRNFGGKGTGRQAGVVGVSCVLTNWTGGWDAENIGFPAQGVLLDYVGCRYHWDKNGFPTDVNINQLLAVTNPQPRTRSEDACP